MRNASPAVDVVGALLAYASTTHAAVSVAAGDRDAACQTRRARASETSSVPARPENSVGPAATRADRFSADAAKGAVYFAVRARAIATVSPTPARGAIRGAAVERRMPLAATSSPPPVVITRSSPPSTGIPSTSWRRREIVPPSTATSPIGSSRGSAAARTPQAGARRATWSAADSAGVVAGSAGPPAPSSRRGTPASSTASGAVPSAIALRAGVMAASGTAAEVMRERALLAPPDVEWSPHPSSATELASAPTIQFLFPMWPRTVRAAG